MIIYLLAAFVFSICTWFAGASPNGDPAAMYILVNIWVAAGMVRADIISALERRR